MSSSELQENTGLLQLERLYAKLYYFIAHQFLCEFRDRGGEEKLRDAVRELAVHRGEQLRRDHEQRGLPISVHSLFTFGGFPGKAGFSRNQMRLTSTERISETLVCPLYDEWQALGGEAEGLCYCEEIHETMWSTYDERIETAQPTIMTRGDKTCRFEVCMCLREGEQDPGQAASNSARASSLTVDEATMRLGELWAKLYYFLATKMLESYGGDGERALREAVREYGRNRGRLIRERHLAEGHTIDLESLFEKYDLPNDPRFRRNKIELTPETRISQTLVCPYAEVWEELAGGKSRVAQLYCEEVHHALFSAYDPAVQTNLCHPLTYEGTDHCMFSVYLRPANRSP